MRYVALVLAIAACVTGLIAAWHWYKASEIRIVPPWTPGGVRPWEQMLADYRRNEELSESTSESARLNKVAALWTAVAVALSGFSSIASAFQ